MFAAPLMFDVGTALLFKMLVIPKLVVCEIKLMFPTRGMIERLWEQIPE